MRRFTTIAWFVLAACFTHSPAAGQVTLQVSAGDTSRTDALVAFTLPPGLKAASSLKLTELGNPPTEIATQLDAATGKLWFVAPGTIPAGGKRTYRLEPGSAASAAKIALIETERAIEVRYNDHALLQYNKAHVEPGEGIDPRFGRSAHLHPVRTPSGAIVTDEFPPDHLHQSGIFYAFTRSKFEDRNVDFWNLAGGKGRVRFQSVEAGTSGPLFASFRTQHEHVDLTAGNDSAEIGKTSGGKVALRETWNVRAWNAGWKSGYWLLDIDTEIRCATDSPLKLPEYHYGGMAIRAARPWVPKEVTFLTSEGDDRLKGNHTRPRWCDIFGLVESKPAGIALFTNPSNYRFPEPLRIHPTMPYMVYTPQFLGDWEITPEKPHRASYRFIIHDGQLSAAQLDSLWQNYAAPLVAVAE
jgi:hypothetical protein